MAISKPHSTSWLLVRALLPSALSLAGCLVMALGIIAAHVVLISLNLGTLLPNFLDGSWAVAYTNTIVQPLTTLLHAPLLNNAATILLWGVTGLMLYTIGSYMVRGVQHWHEAEQDIQFVDQQKIIKHPLLKDSLRLALWRLGVGMGMAAFVLGIQPMLAHIFSLDQKLALGGVDIPTALGMFGRNILALTATAHVTIVFLRLYTLRTRLLGETLY